MLGFFFPEDDLVITNDNVLRLTDTLCIETCNYQRILLKDTVLG